MCASVPLSSVREEEFSELDLGRPEEEIQEGLFPSGAHVCFLKQRLSYFNTLNVHPHVQRRKNRISKGENIFHSASVKKKNCCPLHADLEDLV